MWTFVDIFLQGRCWIDQVFGKRIYERKQEGALLELFCWFFVVVRRPQQSLSHLKVALSRNPGASV